MTEPELPALHPEYLERVDLARLELNCPGFCGDVFI
jgi:hypothetical protein